VRPATDTAQLNTLLPADARAFAMPVHRPFRVRVCRRRETSGLVVFRAVPAGASRASSQLAFLAAVREASQLAALRRDGLATVLEVAKHLAWCASWDTMTSRPTWGVLCERTGRSRASVGRALLRLRRAGLVGVVATGRSGMHSPAAIDKGAAEAAVYVLCVPSPLAAVDKPVDESETPTVFRPGSETHPPHARVSEGPAEPLRGASLAVAALPGAPVEPDELESRPADDRWQQRQDDRLAPARALRSGLPVLRRITDRHVASVIREFVLAGWTTSELVAAIDRRPDQSPWEHDGAAGVDNVGAWLAHRLGAWRDGAGTVRSGPSRLAAAEAHERAARRRAAIERNAAGPAGPESPGLATIRAILSARHPRRIQ
jgi:hypothetical protein